MLLFGQDDPGMCSPPSEKLGVQAKKILDVEAVQNAILLGGPDQMIFVVALTHSALPRTNGVYAMQPQGMDQITVLRVFVKVEGYYHDCGCSL
jgi:hypothetical protein